MVAVVSSTTAGLNAYLEANPGDDACYSMEELKALLRPRFIVTVGENDPKGFLYQDLVIGIDGLLKPVRIKDEGSSFTVGGNERGIDIPLRSLNRFQKFLRENGVGYERWLSWKAPGGSRPRRSPATEQGRVARMGLMARDPGAGPVTPPVLGSRSPRLRAA